MREEVKAWMERVEKDLDSAPVDAEYTEDDVAEAIGDSTKVIEWIKQELAK